MLGKQQNFLKRNKKMSALKKGFPFGHTNPFYNSAMKKRKKDKELKKNYKIIIKKNKFVKFWMH